MGIKTVPHPIYSPDVGPCDFWLFPKLRGCRYETIEEMKEAVTKVIDMLTPEDFGGAFQKLLERYNKCIAARGDYFEADWSFMCVLSIKVLIRKKSVNILYAPRRQVSMYLTPNEVKIHMQMNQIFFPCFKEFSWKLKPILRRLLFSSQNAGWRNLSCYKKCPVP